MPRRTCHVILLLAALTSPVDAQQRDSVDAATAATLARHFERLAVFGASGAIAVSRDGRVVYRGGFGHADVVTRMPMRPDIGTDIASASKQLTAVAVLRLASLGLLRLTDSIGRWFPDAPVDKQPITVHHLLLHQSGLPQYVVEGNDFTVMTREAMRDAILAAPLDFTPGSADQYSDAGYTLLAMVVETVTGERWEDHAARQLIGPLSLTGTTLYGATTTRRRDLAHGYLGDESHGTPAGYVANEDWWVVKGAGGVISTADDLLAWERGLADLLGHDVVDTLLRLRIDDGGVGQSYYGGVVRMPSGRIVNVRTGSQDFGFASGVLRYRDTDVIATLVLNRQPEGMDISPARDALLRDLDAILFGEVPIPAPSASVIPGGERDALAAGTYLLPDSSEIVVRLVDGNLLLTASGSGAATLLAYGRHDPAHHAVVDRAGELMRAICRADTTVVRQLLANERSVRPYMNYLGNVGCRDGASMAEVVAVIPRWYAQQNRDWMVTLLETSDSTAARFRLEWDDAGRVGAAGRGGIDIPAIRAARDPGGDLVAYHIGIRIPIPIHVLADGSLRFPDANLVARRR